MADFMEKSHNWTEDSILDEDGATALSIEAIRAEVEEYATRAYKMVSWPLCLCFLPWPVRLQLTMPCIPTPHGGGPDQARILMP